MARSRPNDQSRRKALRRGALLGGYQPLPGVYDELMDPAGVVRPQWEALLDEWSAFSPDDLTRRLALADRHLSDSGATYRIRADAVGDALAGERQWAVSHMPLPISEQEWATIEAGVIQRAELIESILRDLYGPARLVAEGALPAAAVAGSPDFLRPLQGAPTPGGHHLHLYACDLGRAPDGRWWVLGDRAQAPSGVGYALENRLAMGRAFPDMFRSLNVQRLAAFFQGFRAGFVASAERSEPRICLLTPGSFSETYFEQAYLARYLGFLLVEGSDLVMRDDKVHVRTIAGLKRADVIWRRIDGDFADPLELNASSHLGVAGLIHAIRQESVVIGNSLGSGVVETRALMSFLPRLCRLLRGEDLKLPNVATWWCGQAAERAIVLDKIDEMAIAPAFRRQLPGMKGAEPILAGELSAERKARLIEQIGARGVDYVGQEVVHLSTMPILDKGALQPRPFSLRVYVAATPDGWRVMPGGFCRISDRLDARAISMREGARSSDVWVLASQPVDQTTLLPPSDQIGIRRNLGNLQSRVADNLFWLGRYLERAEGAVRLARTLIGRMIDADVRVPGTTDAINRMTSLLVAWGCAPGGKTPVIEQVIAALHALEHYGSAAASLREARRTASVIRERLSLDAWRLIGDMIRRLESAPERSRPTEGELFETADRALRGLAAFSGLARENMIRGDGWRFLEIGRRIERGVATCRFARHFGDANAPAECLDVLLDLVDCQITYRSRYLIGVAYHPVIDLVMLDEQNPRSVLFQIQRLDQEIAALPSIRRDGLMEAPRRLSLKLAADVGTARTDQVDKAFVLAAEQRLMTLSDAIANRYFLQASEIPGTRAVKS